MEAQCPYQDCLAVFTTTEERVGLCAGCQRMISLRSPEVAREVNKRQQEIEALGKLAIVNEKVQVQGDLICVCEDIRSLWNVGSMFRTSDGAGFSGMLLVGITGTPPRKEINKTSLGSEETVPWWYVRSMTEIVSHLKAQQYQIVGLESTNGVPGIADSTYLSDALSHKLIRKPLCLIVGNEVRGLAMQTLEACDLICHLPMKGMKESLNVAVAFGIAAYAITENF